MKRTPRKKTVPELRMEHQSIPGRCCTCRFWIDAQQMQHVQPDVSTTEFNPVTRECWASNPAVVPMDRRPHTGPFDCCRWYESTEPPK